MSENIDIIESVLKAEEVLYVKVKPEVIHLTYEGCSIAIGVNDEKQFIKLEALLYVGLSGDDKLKTAYELVNSWNFKYLAKFYLDGDGDLAIEWNIDTDSGAFNARIFKIAMARIMAAMEEVKEPIMKLRYVD